jgi:N-6 DNA Methylase
VTSPLPVSPSPEAQRAAAVADAAARWARARGVRLDPGLALWSLAGTLPDPGPVDRAGALLNPAEAVGAALEAATDGGRRRAQGLHVTPGWLADDLVARAVDRPMTVCDPACGGGVFLVAAAERLLRAGASRQDIVRHLLWGADVDPVGLAAAEAALALWAGEAPSPGRLVVGDPLVAGPVLWPDAPPEGFGAVVGNPPFQSQLGRLTARTSAERQALRARWGPALRAYTDTAWLFLLLGCELVRPGGRVVLVQPQSLVAARDAAAVRAAVDQRADLADLWPDDDRVFAAAVRVCAPVLVRRDDPVAAPADRWGERWARAIGLPDLPEPEGAPLGERAVVLAGFRDEYYGLVPAVRESAPGDAPGAVAPLVTSGVLDWGTCAWGARPVRFAKRRWQAPVVDLDRLAAGGARAAGRWVERTRKPKVVVATQTRTLEPAVDVDGTWVPSVPALAVMPHDPDDLWHLGAALAAPAAAVWLARRAAGTGLERSALRVSGPDLAALPLPPDRAAWGRAADAWRAYTARPGERARERFLAAAACAYDAPEAVTAWWRAQSTGAARSGAG